MISWQIGVGGPVRRLDERLGVGVHDHGLLPRGLAELFSDLGNSGVALPVLALVVVGTSWWARRRSTSRWWGPGAAAALAMAAVPLLIVPLKELFDRPGQPTAEGLGYYPSGHTATATVAYGACVLLLLPHLRGGHGRALRRGLVAAWALVSLCVGYGLVRQGYHWPSDVVASWSLAGALLQCLFLAVARGHVARGGPAAAFPAVPPEGADGVPDRPRRRS
ncbi:phosphatase PAP2 family protein [Streptomyces sp. NPDC007088]|uniref:phosphatase PAP2 family protein n=1 Tax=Streptomyces sp. NPDC007088 TaxID=3364773 RepID=UPI0036AE363D